MMDPKKKNRPQLKDIDEQIVIQCCRAYRNGYHLNTVEILSQRYPIKLVRAKMYKMVEKGLLDYGTTIDRAWVVE